MKTNVKVTNEFEGAISNIEVTIEGQLLPLSNGFTKGEKEIDLTPGYVTIRVLFVGEPGAKIKKSTVEINSILWNVVDKEIVLKDPKLGYEDNVNFKHFKL